MKKLTLNSDNCIGCGACVGLDPEHFDFNENGQSHVISEENLDSEALKNAVESCPVQTIALTDDGKKCECGSDCKCDPDCKCGCQDGNPCTCDGECNK